MTDIDQEVITAVQNKIDACGVYDFYSGKGFLIERVGEDYRLVQEKGSRDVGICIGSLEYCLKAAKEVGAIR